jgi:hypothetical protein
MAEEAEELYIIEDNAQLEVIVSNKLNWEHLPDQLWLVNKKWFNDWKEKFNYDEFVREKKDFDQKDEKFKKLSLFMQKMTPTPKFDINKFYSDYHIKKVGASQLGKINNL